MPVAPLVLVAIRCQLQLLQLLHGGWWPCRRRRLVVVVVVRVESKDLVLPRRA